ncbi:hypothetical protein VNI00_008165 [Paramarasmius palmivorus]|uniref:F-box domain-containing protein n=1 Tax=Paramarasmius palmivorus TaxID=297713 RepID=A0AAW0CZ02_9AGAR
MSGNGFTNRPNLSSYAAELIDHILGMLGTADLRACALVCKSWLPAARKHYCETWNRFDLAPSNLPKFVDICSSPHVTIPGSALKGLRIQKASSSIEFTSLLRRKDMPPPLPLRTLKTLEFNYVDLEYWPCKTKECVVFEGVRSLKLCDITFTNLGQLYGMLSAFPSLEDLGLRWEMWSYESTVAKFREMDEVELRLPNLRSLTFSCADVKIANYLPLIHRLVPQLEEYTFLDIDVSDLPHIGALLIEAGKIKVPQRWTLKFERRLDDDLPSPDVTSNILEYLPFTQNRNVIGLSLSGQKWWNSIERLLIEATRGGEHMKLNFLSLPKIIPVHQAEIVPILERLDWTLENHKFSSLQELRCVVHGRGGSAHVAKLWHLPLDIAHEHEEEEEGLMEWNMELITHCEVERALVKKVEGFLPHARSREILKVVLE